MKKGIIVLLITVLAAGMVFAGTLTGSAGISFGFDLDGKDWGFKNPADSTFKFTFNLDTTDVAINTHDTDIWAEITAEAYGNITYDSSKTYTEPVVDADDVKHNVPSWPGLYDIDFGITAANIHIGEDWTIGILGAGGMYDYAADYHTNSDGSPKNDVVISNVVATSGYELTAPGFTVSYKEWAAGFGANGNTDKKSYTVLAHAQTKSFTFAEGLTAQAAGLAYLSDGGKVASASAKVAYAADKLSAGVAGDFQYAEKKFVFEVAANAKYDFVTLNVYTTAGVLTKDSDKYDDDHPVKLDAKLAAGYTFNEEGDVPVTVNGSVDATNVLVKGREINVAANASAKVDAFTFGAGASYAIMAKSLGLNLSVSYEHEKFTAYALVGTDDVGFEFKFGADPALQSLGVELGISSTTIVENATLALVYSGANFVKSGDSVAAKGAITASATISF